MRSENRKAGPYVARYIVKKLDMTRPAVQQTSFRILYESFNETTDRKNTGEALPKNTNMMKISEQTECFGVFQGATQVGFGILRDLKNDTYRISHIAVDEDYRHDGAGRKLVRAMIRSVAERGGGTLILQTDPSKKQERKWFQSMGFSPSKRGTDDGASLSLTVDDRIESYLDLCDALDRYSGLIYGFYAVDEEPYCDTYSVALVLMRAYRLNGNETDEKYHDIMLKERTRINEILRSVSIYFNDRGIQNLPMPLNSNQIDESLARKAAALRAGLGWLGKNDRVVHPIYGSNLVSCRIYINADLPVNTYLRRNNCGDCRACVDACPVGCLKNKKWSARIPRKDIIDESACLEYRSRGYSQTGRYSECDLCVRCCAPQK